MSFRMGRHMVKSREKETQGMKKKKEELQSLVNGGSGDSGSGRVDY